jgi:outer membrane protein assembly factor BamB
MRHEAQRLTWLSMLLGTAIGCETKPDGDTGANTPATPSDLYVMAEGLDIENGGTYCTPLNACHEGNVVALFSEQRTSMSIMNGSNQDLTIAAITIEGHELNQAEEWTLIDTELVPSALDVEGITLVAGEAIDFYPRFFPVQSGERGATITLEDDQGGVYTFDIVGYGSYDSTFFGDGLPSQHKILSGYDSDEQPGGMVVDADASAYFAANVNQIIDNYTEDIMVAKMSADGALEWAKIWNGPYEDLQPDPGQNGESGGSADSIAIDDEGFIYVVGRVSPTNYNSTFYSLILKIDPDDGSLVWEKAWSPKSGVSIASESSQFYAVHADGDRIYAVGTTSGEAEVSLVIFDLDGNVQNAGAIDIHAGENDRGYAVTTDDSGNVFIAGNGSGDAILLKVAAPVDGRDYDVEWAFQPGLGTGGNINSIDVDENGDVYVSYDVRGAQTHFLFGKVSGDNGAEIWTKEYVGNYGDKNNIHVVRYIDGTLYAGGRTGPELLDGQMGDGLVVAVNPEDGSEDWSSEYFNGKGSEELCEHRVKGIAIDGDEILTYTQAYTGTANYERYWGYWYQGSGSLEDAGVSTSTRTATVSSLPDNEAADAADFRNDWTDAPSSVAFVDAPDAMGTAPDAAMMLMRIAP